MTLRRSLALLAASISNASAAMTLDLYGHLYEDDLDALSEALDRRFAAATASSQSVAKRASADSPAPYRAPKGSATVVALDRRVSKTLT